MIGPRSEPVNWLRGVGMGCEPSGGFRPKATPFGAKLSCRLRKEPNALSAGEPFGQTTNRGFERVGGGAGCHAGDPERIRCDVLQA